MFKDWNGILLFIYLVMLFESLAFGIILEKYGVDTIKATIKNLIERGGK